MRGPFGIAWELDSPLYRTYASDSSWNTGHVNDATITAMLKTLFELVSRLPGAAYRTPSSEPVSR